MGPNYTWHLPVHFLTDIADYINEFLGFPGGSVVKKSTRQSRDAGLIPGSGRSPGEGNGNPLQSSCLEDPLDHGAWRITVHWGHKESDATDHTQY